MVQVCRGDGVQRGWGDRENTDLHSPLPLCLPAVVPLCPNDPLPITHDPKKRFLSTRTKGATCLVFLNKFHPSGEHFMAKTTNATTQTGKFPYPFRTGWALVLLAINFVVAAFYFHIIE